VKWVANYSVQQGSWGNPTSIKGQPGSECSEAYGGTSPCIIDVKKKGKKCWK